MVDVVEASEAESMLRAEYEGNGSKSCREDTMHMSCALMLIGEKLRIAEDAVALVSVC
jgi:hypothetical protein